MGLAFLLTLIACNYLACMNKRILLLSLSLMSEQINTSNFPFVPVTCEVSVNTLGYIEAQVCDIKTDHWATKNVLMLLWSIAEEEKATVMLLCNSTSSACDEGSFLFELLQVMVHTSCSTLMSLHLEHGNCFAERASLSTVLIITNVNVRIYTNITLILTYIFFTA